MSHLSLVARGLHLAYERHRVLTGADLTVTGGRRVALLGANGSGKTTLLRCLSGALRPAGGEIVVGDRELSHDRAALARHRREVQLVLQDPDDQLFSADVRRDVSFGPLNLGLDPVQAGARVEETLGLLGLTALADRPVHRLSFGERKRAAIAGAVAMRPCVLLLDEPTAGLDGEGVQEMLAALRRLEEHETTVVIATHDVDLALSWADEAAVVCDGRVVQDESVQVLGRPDLLARARLRRPWVLELAGRLGVRPGPDDPPLRDLDSLAALLDPRTARHRADQGESRSLPDDELADS